MFKNQIENNILYNKQNNNICAAASHYNITTLTATLLSVFDQKLS